MTPEQPIEAAKRLAQQLQEVAHGATHSVLLIALLGLYQEVAVDHPCCLPSAAQNAFTVGLQLARAAAAQNHPPVGAPIH